MISSLDDKEPSNNRMDENESLNNRLGVKESRNYRAWMKSVDPDQLALSEAS